MAGISKYLLAAALVVSGVQSTHGRTAGAETRKSPPERLGSQVMAQHQPSPPKTEADYYVPLDNWLKSHGSPLSGRDFYEVGKQYHVDPDFLISVSMAETSLARTVQRGTPCNVGSVASYDSTSTTASCRSYREGIELIAQTVNNPLLRQYWKVSQLSRCRNFSGAVYATSTENWDHNVVNTMSDLKGRHETDYQFRT